MRQLSSMDAYDGFKLTLKTCKKRIEFGFNKANFCRNNVGETAHNPKHPTSQAEKIIGVSPPPTRGHLQQLVDIAGDPTHPSAMPLGPTAVRGGDCDASVQEPAGSRTANSTLPVLLALLHRDVGQYI